MPRFLLRQSFGHISRKNGFLLVTDGIHIGCRVPRFLLRQSFGHISRKNGFLLVTDGIHMNSRGWPS
ncbi:MAG: hypothetical protein DRI40_02695, partial [Chloroflexi bacterium]